jgi:hypothetical protein
MAGRCSYERRLNRSMAANTATSAGFAARHDPKGFLQQRRTFRVVVIVKIRLATIHPRGGATLMTILT